MKKMTYDSTRFASLAIVGVMLCITFGPQVALAQSGGLEDSTVTNFTVSKHITVSVDIDGKSYHLDTDNITPDTKVTVNKEVWRFGDLDPKLQHRIQESVGKVDVETQVSVDSGAKPHVSNMTDITVSVNGNQYHLSVIGLKPDTLLTLNGKPMQFSDLTPEQQKQLRTVMDTFKSVHVSSQDDHINVSVSSSAGAASGAASSSAGGGAGGTSSSSISKGPSGTNVAVSIDGMNYTLNTTQPNDDTPITVNGASERFGDLSAEEQKQVRAAIYPSK